MTDDAQRRAGDANSGEDDEIEPTRTFPKTMTKSNESCKREQDDVDDQLGDADGVSLIDHVDGYDNS